MLAQAPRTVAHLLVQTLLHACSACCAPLALNFIRQCRNVCPSGRMQCPGKRLSSLHSPARHPNCQRASTLHHSVSLSKLKQCAVTVNNPSALIVRWTSVKIHTPPHAPTHTSFHVMFMVWIGVLNPADDEWPPADDGRAFITEPGEPPSLPQGRVSVPVRRAPPRSSKSRTHPWPLCMRCRPVGHK